MNDMLTRRAAPFVQTVQDAAARFAQSPAYGVVVFLIAYASLVLDCPAAGLCTMVFLLSFLCAFLPDMLPMLLPLLLTFCLAFLEPEQMETLPPALIVVMVLCALSAIAWRVVRYRQNIRPGLTFWAMPAVAAALFLGGVGSLEADVYFSGTSLYHMAGLGLLPIAVYLVVKTSDDGRGRTYDVGDKACAAMYVCAVFLSYAVVRVFILHPEVLRITAGNTDQFSYMQWRNTAANLTVMLLPAVFYYARRHHPIHLLSACAIYGISVMTGSRGALVIGFLCMVAGAVYFLYRRPRAWVWIVSAAAALVVLCLLFWQPLYSFVSRFIRLRILAGDDGYSILEESRVRLFLRGVQDFLGHPLNGTGLAYRGNEDIAPVPVGMRIPWYHCAPVQVIGSLGLLGVAAYGYQLYLRLRLIVRGEKNAYTVALAVSYIALLVYSLIDPGLFSPLPFAVLGTLLIVLLESAASQKHHSAVAG